MVCTDACTISLRCSRAKTQKPSKLRAITDLASVTSVLHSDRHDFEIELCCAEADRQPKYLKAAASYLLLWHPGYLYDVCSFPSCLTGSFFPLSRSWPCIRNGCQTGMLFQFHVQDLQWTSDRFVKITDLQMCLFLIKRRSNKK